MQTRVGCKNRPWVLETSIYEESSQKKKKNYWRVTAPLTPLKLCLWLRQCSYIPDNRNTHNSTSSTWEKINHGVPQGSILGPLFFLFYINDLPKITTKNAKLSPYSDDTSVIVTNPSPRDFKISMNKVFVDINEWFRTNVLSLNFKKNPLPTIQD